MRHLRRHPLEYLALFLALGGVAYAAQLAPKNSVASKSIRSGAVTGPKLASNAVTGASVVDGSLGAADLAHTPGDESIGRSATVQSNACNPSATAVTCANVTLHLAKPARVLVEADGRPGADPAAIGSCQLAVDGAGLSSGTAGINGLARDSFALNGITGVLGAGSHTLAMICSEQAPDFIAVDTHISAVSLSPG